MTFEKQNPSVTVQLFPMVHVGEQRFYDETFAEASDCDVILFEGIESSVGRNLTRSYRWLGLEKLGLVVQPQLNSDAAKNSKLVHADLNSDEFHREWKKIKFSLRMLFFLFAPIYAISRRLIGSRESLAKYMALDDLASSDEVLRWSADFEAFNNCIADARDKRLIDVLDKEIASSDPSGKTIGIVYGARHMRPVIRHLTKEGCLTRRAKWAMVFSV